MNIRLLLPLSLISCLLPLRAADDKAAPAPAAAAPTKPVDFSAFKTADDFWKHIEKLQEPPTKKPTSREEAQAQVKEWFGNLRTACEAFVKAFPADPRSWQARMYILRADRQLASLRNETPDRAEEAKKLDEIINAPDAPASLKGEATFSKVMALTGALDKEKPETFAAFHKAAADFVAKYPDHPLTNQLKGIQMRVLAEDPTPEGAAMLKKIAEGSDARLAEGAKAILEKQQKLTSLKTKPVDLKFTAVDGQPIDLANLRGKVVLVDFWASWCGPCMGEMPNVVSTYGKLHPQGFEIVGISLDQDKEAMQGAMKKQGMTWAQYFDGGGWENKISKGFGIDSIPAAWLIDKKGMLREQGLRGEELGQAVEKLLKE
jgi:thiol-disulfide isomerase/thioredoxin